MNADATLSEAPQLQLRFGRMLRQETLPVKHKNVHVHEQRVDARRHEHRILALGEDQRANRRLRDAPQSDATPFAMTGGVARGARLPGSYARECALPAVAVRAPAVRDAIVVAPPLLLRECNLALRELRPWVQRPAAVRRLR